jgi:hypothetical protein
MGTVMGAGAEASAGEVEISKKQGEVPHPGTVAKSIGGKEFT